MTLLIIYLMVMWKYMSIETLCVVVMTTVKKQ